MRVYIGIEDLVANALIELLEQCGKREVMFRELDAYGAIVIKYLNEEMNEQAVLLLSKERTNAFLHDYAEFFELCTRGKEEGVRLRDGITSEQLWVQFRSYLSADIIRAFINKTNVDELIQVVMGNRQEYSRNGV